MKLPALPSRLPVTRSIKTSAADASTAVIPVNISPREYAVNAPKNCFDQHAAQRDAVFRNRRHRRDLDVIPTDHMLHYSFSLSWRRDGDERRNEHVLHLLHPNCSRSMIKQLASRKNATGSPCLVGRLRSFYGRW